MFFKYVLQLYNLDFNAKKDVIQECEKLRKLRMSWALPVVLMQSLANECKVS
jgi:hypothetical protein